MIRYLAWLLAATIVLVGLLFGLREWVAANAVRSDYTDDRSLHPFIIGNDRLSVPLNLMRNASQRRIAGGNRLDLSIHWPSGLGYTADLRGAFDRSSHQLITIMITQRDMTAGMSERLASVYAELFEEAPYSGPAGLLFQRLDGESGYEGEALAIAVDETVPWIARCPVDMISGEPARDNTCLHDYQAGQGLSVTYRFDTRYLPQWKAIDGLVKKQVDALLGN